MRYSGAPMQSAPPPAPATTFSDLLAQRSFMRLWLARIASTSGQQMLMVAMGWHMYDLTSSAWDLGLVGLAQFLPVLCLTLVAGHAIDRFHRARIVTLSVALQTVVALALILATHGGPSGVRWDSRELLLGLSVLLGVARAFQHPAQQALTPMLVPAALLPRALAFSSSAQQISIIAAPALGGLIFTAGVTAVYLCCAVLTGAGVALLLGVTYQHRRLPSEPVTVRQVFAGFEFIWRRKPMLGAISLDLFAVLLGGATALLPIFARDILHTGPWGLGLLRGAPAVGALLTSAVLTRWPLERRVGRKMLTAVAVFGLCMVVFGLSEHLIVSWLALAISGGADMVSVVVRQTLVQLETPDEMRGRVAAVNSIFVGASNELGEFESGATAALIGPVASVTLGGVITVLVALAWLRVFPELARRDRLR
jgi:MFS family permease